MAASYNCHSWSPHTDYSALFGDQPFAKLALCFKFSRPSTANTPRGHEEGELALGKVVLCRTQDNFFSRLRFAPDPQIPHRNSMTPDRVNCGRHSDGIRSQQRLGHIRWLLWKQHFQC